MQQSARSPFPNKPQELLLKAALQDREHAITAWKEWRKTVDFERDVDHGSHRLLPLVYHWLSSFNYSDELISGRLKGIYRRAWMENQQLFYKASNVLRILHDAKIKTAVLKGIALTELVYRNYGVRPMYDMDILVPFDMSHHAVKILKQEGFVLQREDLLEHNLQYGRSIGFVDSDNTEIDLHWHVVVHSHGNVVASDFWDESVPLSIGEVKTRALSATDNLFHTIVHGVRKNPEPPIRWVADAVSIINSEHCQVNWKRLLFYAGKLRVYLQIKKALLYIKDTFDADIPDEIINQLYEYNPSFVERVVFNHGETIGDNAQDLTMRARVYSFYARYLRQTNRQGLLSIHAGLVAYGLQRLFVRLKEY